ncbi:hypothetical protein [Tropicimonas sp. IMCC34011]|uniref:hypothetical protein n=1 Tax=Tropicimonas sp. IMCC34011 TaxID=2248759 RepID=UPI0013003917|nr:hypothetical protein [Tropicimonas sp. IMCC34011]
MPRRRLTLPPSSWPEDLRERFERHSLSAAQRTRLRRGLGRWFRLSMDLGADARDATRETWKERTQGLSRPVRNEVRQALAIVFPDAAASLYEGDNQQKGRSDPRDQLRAIVERNLARFPDAWRAAAAPLLHVDADGLGDGILVQAWAPSTIQRRVETAAHHFDWCRARGLPEDITPDGLRAKLREDQARVARGERRLGGVSVDLEALAGLAQALRPERDWAWLKTARDRLKKLAANHGSRNAARAVDAAELRVAGQQLLAKADAAHAVARHRRDFVVAHTRARTALTIILLAEAPIRLTGCAELELGESLLGDLRGLFLDAGSTKEANTDRRMFSATLIDAIGRYVRLHRAVIAAPGETRLFVGERGGPVKGAQLSKILGDYTEPVFRVRVTPHAVRHSVANFIAATAPEEAALASIILNHKGDDVTPVYTQRGDQIIASRKLGKATRIGAAELEADTAPTRRGRSGPRPGKARRRNQKPRRAPRRTRGG